mmetsp:Transcript_18733/g.30597  ORF Transcript_18733/g.30597 Transcript_18733/m.30597 type:complete len:515 (+) Transcript_18733:249-1793(+)
MEQVDMERASSPPTRRRGKGKRNEYEAVATKEEETSGEGRGLQGDYLNVAILLFLYTLQGVPLGLSQTMDLLLQEKKLSYDEQGVFNSVSWPYSLKILWAPIVDTIFIKTFGRRKSWLVPTQLLIGILLLVTPSILDSLLGEDGSGKPKVFELTALFFVFYLLAATQDIALDGWAVTMLSRRNIGYASTCNAIGQTFGFFIAFTGYLGLKVYGLADLGSFMYTWGVIFVVTTLMVAFFKHEKSEKEIQEDTARDAAEEGTDAHHGEIPVSIGHAYEQMRQVVHLPGVKALIFLLFTRGIAFASADSLSQRKLLERGMKKEHVASLTVLITPLNIVLPGILSKYTTDRPLGLFRKAFVPRVLIGFLSLLLVLFAPDFEQHPDAIPWTFFISLVFVVVLHSVVQCAMFVAIMGFFAQVSDPAIGGTYMTLLNTIANLGGKWPNQLVLFLVDHVTLRDCDETGENCVVVVDGFVFISIGCILYGLLWFRRYESQFEHLQDLDLSAWRVSAAVSSGKN